MSSLLSLAPSSSVSSSFFPPPPALAHSLNSRGELGMFVNPYACSCATCVDYVAERAPDAPALTHEEPPAEGDGDGSSSVGFSNTAPAEPPAEPAVLPTRSLGGGIGGLSALGRSTGALGGGLGRSSTGYVEGWGGEERPLFFGPSATGAGVAPSLGPSSSSPFFFPRVRSVEDEEEFCDILRSYRSTLQLQSTADMTDADLQERDRKIRAIEDCLLAFGSFFRTG